MSCRSRKGCAIWASAAFAAGFVAFLVAACIDLKYGLTHYYTADDLSTAKTRAFDFCNATRCISNCSQFNTLMVLQQNVNVMKFICSDACTGCSSFCTESCTDLWTVYNHIMDETGEDGQYRYDRGTGLLAAAIICAFVSVMLWICQQ